MRPTPRLIRRFATLTLAIGLIAALAAANAAAVRGQAAGQPEQISITFGPSAIWQPSQEAVQQLHMCNNVSFTCVRGVMEQAGATPDAIAFYHLTAWFLTDLQDTGVVQLGTILNPWAANENSQLILLGGTPAVIFPNQNAATFGPALDRDPTYAAIKNAHEDAMFWPFGPTFAGVTTSPGGGQRFLLDYEVLDGCHACAGLAQVRLGFDFAPDGTQGGVHLVEVIPQATP